jgi:hypothetical protein
MNYLVALNKFAPAHSFHVGNTGPKTREQTHQKKRVNFGQRGAEESSLVHPILRLVCSSSFCCCSFLSVILLCKARLAVLLPYFATFRELLLPYGNSCFQLINGPVACLHPRKLPLSEHDSVYHGGQGQLDTHDIRSDWKLPPELLSCVLTRLQ